MLSHTKDASTFLDYVAEALVASLMSYGACKRIYYIVYIHSIEGNFADTKNNNNGLNNNKFSSFDNEVRVFV